MTVTRATEGAGSRRPVLAPWANASRTQGRAPTTEAPGGDHRNDSSPWYLVYLVIMAFPLLASPRTTPLDWVLSIIVAVGFAAFYLAVGAAPARGRFHRAAPVAAAVLGVAFLPVNLGTTVMLVYSAAFAGDAWPRPRAVRWFALLSVLALVPLAVPTLVGPVPLVFRLWSTLPTLFFIWIVGLETIVSGRRERAHAALRVESSRIEAIATLTERERLARDVHDSVGQSLTSVIVRSQLARRLVSVDPERARDELAELERVARAALSDVRTTVSGWRHVHLDGELALATAMLAAAGVVTSVDRDAALQVCPEAETVLALALREAVTNVVRHAGASQVSITVGGGAGGAGGGMVTVTDDGVGVRARPGGGLSGMRERLESLGGALGVEAAVPRGTRLRASVPAAPGG